MELVGLSDPGQKLVVSYGTGQFKVGEHLYMHSILLLRNNVFYLDIENVNQLTESVLERVFLASPKLDVLLIGYGVGKGRVNCQLTNALHNKAIGFDVMNTGAACRTYNVLALEERQVAAVLIPL